MCACQTSATQTSLGECSLHTEWWEGHGGTLVALLKTGHVDTWILPSSLRFDVWYLPLGTSDLAGLGSKAEA
jgi:hypothetical protein